MSPDDPRHGTRAGYYAHRRDGETACADCKRAAARTEAMRQLAKMEGQPTSHHAFQVSRRIQGLIALGWTQTQIAEHAGMSPGYVQYLERAVTFRVKRSTFERIRDTYEALCMTVPGDSYGATRARARAKRRHYAAPLAWDDIDDIDATPSGSKTYRSQPVPRPAALCGTDSGYYRHRRTLKEPACQECLDAHREYEEARKARSA